MKTRNHRSRRFSRVAPVLVLSFVAACGASDPPNGTVVCGSGAKACPDNYHCSVPSNTCWRNGSDPDAAVAIDTVPASFEVGAEVPSAGDVGGSSDAGKLDGPSTLGDATLGDDAVAKQDVVVAADVLGPTDVPQSLPDATVQADAKVLPDGPALVDAAADATSCPTGKVACNGVCLDAGACCVASDCTGSCMTCDATHACVAVKGQADPTGRCAGTCDATGACKGKLGQPCTAVGGGCANGTFCAPEGICCDKACTDSCEACDASGTCKPVAANTAPKPGHPACVAAVAACAGTCDGVAAACAYPTGACGTASCTSTVYQPAGTCNKGACATPAPETCSNACVVASGGCTGVCAPNAVQCSATGRPQKCSASGAWQDQPACGTGFACVAGTCTCAKTACGTACVDLATDKDNCGQCGHGCQGGACTAGKCQPVVVANNLDSTTSIIGIDGQYVYYQDNPDGFQGNAAFDAHRIAKTASNGTGTELYVGTYRDTFHGVVGTSLLMVSGYPKYICSIASTTSCTGTRTELDTVSAYGKLIPWRTPSPSTFAHYEPAEDLQIGWLSPSGGVVANFTELAGVEPASYWGLTASGESVYWIRSLSGDISLFSSSSSSPTTKSRLASGLVATMDIVDANPQSVLLWNDTTGGQSLHRVPVQGAAAPALLSNVVPAPAFRMATEDASAVYWFDGDGILNRCTPASCSSTKSPMANGSQPTGALFQDATTLYWLNTNPYSIVRLAK